MHRGEREEARRILEVLPALGGPWDVDTAAARLDALLSLGEAEELEREATLFLGEESYTRPFALRALGISRGDESLVSESVASFRAMGLDWRVEETRVLAAGLRWAEPRTT
jgi:hypothetical protein